MTSKKFTALVFFVALGSCYKRSENPKPQSLTETVEVVWSLDAEVQITNKKNIWLFGERVAVEYTMTTGTLRNEQDVNVTLDYSPRKSGPNYVIVIDIHNDGRADRVYTPTPWVDVLRPYAEKPTPVFRHADLVLAKLRKELRVDEVLKLGPNVPFDPFVQEN